MRRHRLTGGRRRFLTASAAMLITAAMIPVATAASAAPAGKPSANPPSHGKDFWHATGKPAATHNGHKAALNAKKMRPLTLDKSGLRNLLSQAPKESPKVSGVEVELPAPDGTFQRFTLEQNTVMSSGLAAKHPEITTYSGRGVDDPTATLRADVTPLGFHASVRTDKGNWYIDPYYNRDDSVYASYYGADLVNSHGALVEPDDAELHAMASRDLGIAADVPTGPSVTLRTYRLALLTDPSYASFFGPENVTAAKVTLMNRVNQIYEADLAVRMILIDETDQLSLDTAEKATGPNGPCGSAACFTPAQIASCGSSTLSRNRIVLGQLIGASRYDIGHIGLGVNGGGVASLGVVGGNSKAQGCTGLPAPTGDYYAVDYVAHEMGHQFSGNHTFNGTQYNCSGGNRSAANSVEPGSGSSVMAYAGICQQDNLQPHSDPYFSQRTITEVTAYITSNRAAINEVQTVSLRDFDTNGDSFTLSYQGKESAPIVRGVNYTTTGIAAAVSAITGGTVSVAAFGGSGTLNDTGFQLTWSGTLAGQKLDVLELTNANGTSGFVGETAQGGPIQNGGYTQTLTDNHAPVVTTPSVYTIPLRTPFTLTGSATDSDGDSLTYLWEQNDRGNAGTALVSNTKTTGPLFRVFGKANTVTPEGTLQTPSPGLNLADGNPTRVFPDIEQILADNTNAKSGLCPAAPAPPPTGGASNVPADIVDCFSEFLPTKDYVGMAGVNNEPSLNFRLTARDNHPGAGGTGYSDTKLKLAANTGPFRVTSHSTAVTLEGGTPTTVTWDVAGTNAAPISTANVKISLSTDGGYTYPVVLKESTPNNGSASVVLPNPSATVKARLKVEAVGNVYFDINHADLTITPSLLVSNNAPAGGAVVQYSDGVVPGVTVSAESGDNDGASLTAIASGLPAGLSLVSSGSSAAGNRPGTQSWTVSGKVSGAPASYPVTVTVKDPSGRSKTTSFTVVVKQEDARVTYTGSQFSTTSSPTSSTGTLTLSATVQDISATADAAGDVDAGDVRNATVKFFDRDSGITLCTANVGLVNASDTSVGTATCNYGFNLGSADAAIYTIGMVVDGYYTRNSTEDDAVVTVAKPVASNFIAGGGFLKLEKSAGLKAGDSGSKANAGFNVKYNAGGKNLQGNVNVIVHRTEADGIVHTYQVKGNVLSSLAVTGNKATFTGKANIKDITNPAAPISIDGNATIELVMTDNGDPGSTDTLGITVLNKSGGTWFSSNWNGLKTVEQTLGGGNLRVK